MSTPRPNALDRIQKLDRAERLRLEAAEKREKNRVDTLGSSVVRQPEFEAVERFARRTNWPMAVLGVAWGVLAVVLLTTDLNGVAPVALVWTLVVIWAVVVVEFLIRLVLAPDSRAYLSARSAEPALVVVPTLQPLRLLGMERVSVVARELWLRTRAILLHRGLNRALITVAWLVFFGAWLELLFEDHAPGSNIHDYWNSLWWAIVTLTTVGYGDRFPVSVGGRIVAIVVMLMGIGLLGVVTATVASYFVQEHTDAAKQSFADAHDEVTVQLGELSDRMVRLEALLVSVTGTAVGTPGGTTSAPSTGAAGEGTPDGSTGDGTPGPATPAP